MAPPLIFLSFVILVLAIVAIGGFIALRAGLWVRETSMTHPLDPNEGTDDRRHDLAPGDDQPARPAREPEGRERAYGSRAATDDRVSRPTHARS